MFDSLISRRYGEVPEWKKGIVAGALSGVGYE